MYKSTPHQMQGFVDGLIWQDLKEEVNAWITELQETLSDPDGPKDIETISMMRGSIKACKNFLQMPEVLIENMSDDIRHEQNERKKNWR